MPSATVDNAPSQERRLADTDDSSLYGDHTLEADLTAGGSIVRISHEMIFAGRGDGAMDLRGRNGFAARCGDVAFGSGFACVWPHTWSGESRLFFYSLGGVSRAWTRPREWAKFERGTLFCANGRRPVELHDGCD